jgi:manganese/zinc/iron transport system permease protein
VNRAALILIVVWAMPTLLASPALAQDRSITDTSVSLPSASEILQVLMLRDYNTRVVVLGTAALGVAAGMIGTFMLLRKRALLGDALSHATLPGLGIAFILMVQAGGSGKSLPGLLIGATISGLIGVGCILLIRSYTRIKEDAALGIVLSVFFGLGVAILGVIQNMGSGSAAGLESFIYGKTASMLRSDALIIAGTGLLVAIICAVLFKEFSLLCFDQPYARTQGWPVAALDLILMTFVTAVTVIGLQAVGLILVIAMLIIPPAAARFWTERLSIMFFLSAAIGGVSGMLGAALSALVPRLPAGAIIVVTAAIIFLISMLFGPARGVIVNLRRRVDLNRRVARQHLLRGIYELIEGDDAAATEESLAQRSTPIEALLAERSWSLGQLRRLLERHEQEGLVAIRDDGRICLRPAGLEEARRLVRNHRLWEIYLITHADIAPSHVDRDADTLEHVLGREMVAKLETILAGQRAPALPSSPHVIVHARGGAT